MKVYTNYSNHYNNDDRSDISEQEAASTAEIKLGKVFNCDKVYLRSSDSKDSEPIDVLNKDEELFVEDVIGDWCKVTTAVGKSGYVMKQFVNID